MSPGARGTLLVSLHRNQPCPGEWMVLGSMTAKHRTLPWGCHGNQEEKKAPFFHASRPKGNTSEDRQGSQYAAADWFFAGLAQLIKLRRRPPSLAISKNFDTAVLLAWTGD